MLNSSVVALPPVPRPLKRSASTASLPTPPRTHHKRRHTRSRGLSDCDSDSGSATATDEDNPTRDGNENKKGRTTDNRDEDEDEDEDAFWMGTASSKVQNSKTQARAQSHSPSTSVSPAPLLYRRRQTNTAPVSPPPSRRKTTVVTKSLPASPRADSPPVTPELKQPVRDSPSNPFLASPMDLASDGSASRSINASPSPRTPHRENPTITYVFRGVRAQFANPLYDHVHNRPLSPSSTSRLPSDHPDFSPDPSCPPKLLFPGPRRMGATRRDRSRRRHEREQESPGMGRRHRSGDRGSSEEDDDALEEEEMIQPMKLNFGDRSPRTREGPVNVRQKEERDDPIRRAMGPVRR